MHGVVTLAVVLIMSLVCAESGRGSASFRVTKPFNPSGDYHPFKLPADWLDKFTQFDLKVRRSRGALLASGEVMNVGTRYKFATVSITEQTLKFRTVSVRGVSYSFDGRFLGRGDFPSQFTGYGMLMLEGTLTKFERGRKAAEMTSTFMYYPGC